MTTYSNIMATHNEKKFHALLENVKKRLSYYKAEYKKADGFSEDFSEHKRQDVCKACASFLEGVELAILFSFGADALSDFQEFISEMDLEFCDTKTITGIVI